MTRVPPPPTKDTLAWNSAVQVRVSTSPVTGRPQRSWKDSTAPRVIGPKMPSSSTPTWRWTAATAAPVSPSDKSADAGRWIADRSGAAAAETDEELAAIAASGWTAGVMAMLALTASVAPLRRVA
jgi:hypothetical protein